MICSTNQNGVVNGKKLFLLVFCWFFWAAWPDICTTHASMTKRWEEEERQAGKEFFFLMLGNHKNWGDIVKNGWSFPFLSKADFSLNSRSNFALVFKFYSANVNIIFLSKWRYTIFVRWIHPFIFAWLSKRQIIMILRNTRDQSWYENFKRAVVVCT